MIMIRIACLVDPPMNRDDISVCWIVISRYVLAQLIRLVISKTCASPRSLLLKAKVRVIIFVHSLDSNAKKQKSWWNKGLPHLVGVGIIPVFNESISC